MKTVGKIITGIIGGFGAGFGLGTWLEKVSNEYTLADVNEEKEISLGWVSESEALTYVSTKKQQKEVVDAMIKVATANTLDDVERFSKELDDILENLVSEYFPDIDEELKEAEEAEKMEDERDGQHSNNEAGEESDPVVSQSNEENMPEESESEESKSSIQSQETVQENEEEAAPVEDSHNNESGDLEPPLIEIRCLANEIVGVVGSSITKDLINKYVGYVASLESTEPDAFYITMSDLTAYIRENNEEEIVKAIYSYLNSKKKK